MRTEALTPLCAGDLSLGTGPNDLNSVGFCMTAQTQHKIEPIGAFTLAMIWPGCGHAQ